MPARCGQHAEGPLAATLLAQVKGLRVILLREGDDRLLGEVVRAQLHDEPRFDVLQPQPDHGCLTFMNCTPVSSALSSPAALKSSNFIFRMPISGRLDDTRRDSTVARPVSVSPA